MGKISEQEVFNAAQNIASGIIANGVLFEALTEQAQGDSDTTMAMVSTLAWKQAKNIKHLET